MRKWKYQRSKKALCVNRELWQEIPTNTQRNMYSPKIKDDLIPRLYQASQRRGIPMTELVHEALEEYLTRSESVNAIDRVMDKWDAPQH
jgi:hypothetical protein